MSTNDDIAALVTRQTTAVTSIEGSATTLSQFMNNDANTPIQSGGQSVPSLQGVIAQALATAGRRNYEITFSHDDLSPYTSAANHLFRVFPSSNLSFPAGLTGSSFHLATPPQTAMSVQFQLGSSTVTVQFGAGQTVGSIVSGAGSAIAVSAGSLISGVITSDIFTATGLAITLLAQTTS